MPKKLTAKGWVVWGDNEPEPMMEGEVNGREYPAGTSAGDYAGTDTATAAGTTDTKPVWKPRGKAAAKAAAV